MTKTSIARDLKKTSCGRMPKSPALRCASAAAGSGNCPEGRPRSGILRPALECVRYGHGAGGSGLTPQGSGFERIIGVIYAGALSLAETPATPTLAEAA